MIHIFNSLKFRGLFRLGTKVENNLDRESGFAKRSSFMFQYLHSFLMQCIWKLQKLPLSGHSSHAKTLLFHVKGGFTKYIIFSGVVHRQGIPRKSLSLGPAAKAAKVHSCFYNTVLPDLQLTQFGGTFSLFSS
jgi:hypothetical protein